MSVAAYPSVAPRRRVDPARCARPARRPDPMTPPAPGAVGMPAEASSAESGPFRGRRRQTRCVRRAVTAPPRPAGTWDTPVGRTVTVGSMTLASHPAPAAALTLDVGRRDRGGCGALSTRRGPVGGSNPSGFTGAAPTRCDLLYPPQSFKVPPCRNRSRALGQHFVGGRPAAERVKRPPVRQFLHLATAHPRHPTRRARLDGPVSWRPTDAR